ncbi:MAG: class I SAM-dependent rRNA methyltransferase [Dysgonamonadaceae bacterium]|jgi:23S rRNA (cytosine1962-C5)-methyltransferase|nr:class I SAM-dependent rRNA methyltransferase [Dysgonamonadaceae bacterium]
MPYAKIYLNAGKEESLKRFHPWVFSGAVNHIEGRTTEGDIVEIYDSKGNYLATGHCQIGSIAVRILSFRKEKIDGNFWKQRIESAFQLRQNLGLLRTDNNTFRLIHGEGDNLSGLIVDIYGNTAVVQAHSPGMHIARMEIAEALKTVLGNIIQNIYYKSESTLPFNAKLDAEDDYLFREQSVSDIVVENRLKLKVDWQRGQKTGFFVDQRENRLLLEQFAHNRSVLNMFCYTGGFSCFAMRGGAALVHSVDSSAKAIDLTNENVALNFPSDTRHQAFTEDAFDFLEKTEKGKYDLIILDPPAFAKHRKVLKNALQGYKKLNAAAMEKIREGGILFTFSCSQVVSKEDFRLAVFSAAAQTGRRVKILKQLTQQADHPINIYHPESEYIKGLLLYVEQER